MNAGSLNLMFASRDFLAVNDLDSNGTDELNVVTTTNANSFQVFRYSAGALSRVGNIQSLGRTIAAFSVGRLSAGHTRPDLVYTDGTKIYVRRANPNFMP